MIKVKAFPLFICISMLPVQILSSTSVTGDYTNSMFTYAHTYQTHLHDTHSKAKPLDAAVGHAYPVNQPCSTYVPPRC